MKQSKSKTLTIKLDKQKHYINKNKIKSIIQDMTLRERVQVKPQREISRFGRKKRKIRSVLLGYPKKVEFIKRKRRGIGMSDEIRAV